MHITTLIFFALLAFFTWRGYQKGFISSITRLLSWIVAYPAALIFTPTAAALLVQHTPLTGIIVYFVAGTGTFLLVSLVVSLLLNAVGKLIPENYVTNTGSKMGGAGVGVLVGALAGLLAVYILGLVLTTKEDTSNQNMPNNNLENNNLANNTTTNHAQTNSTTGNSAPLSVPTLRNLEGAKDSFIEASAKKLMGVAVGTAVDLAVEDKTASQLAKAFAQDPQTMLIHAQHMKNSGQLQTLLANENIQSLLTTGDTLGLMHNPEFQALINTPGMQALMKHADVTSEAGAEAAADKMVLAWNHMQRIKNDPRVVAIMSDPEFQQQLNSTNKLPLMMNPKLNQLTQIIFTPATMVANDSRGYDVVDLQNNQTTPATAHDNDQTPTQIYRWTDTQGQVHYSDQPLTPAQKSTTEP